MRRYLINDELPDAEMPDWYPLVRAARYLGVPPWELAEQPVLWQRVALIAQAAENEAEAALSKPPDPVK